MSTDRIEKLDKTVNTINTRTADILKLLKDDDFGQAGLVTDHNLLKNEFYKTKRDHERRIERIYWTASGAAIIISLAIALMT